MTLSRTVRGMSRPRAWSPETNCLPLLRTVKLGIFFVGMIGPMMMDKGDECQSSAFRSFLRVHNILGDFLEP